MRVPQRSVVPITHDVDNPHHEVSRFLNVGIIAAQKVVQRELTQVRCGLTDEAVNRL